MLQVEDMIIVTSISKQFCNFLLADNKTDKNTTLYVRILKDPSNIQRPEYHSDWALLTTENHTEHPSIVAFTFSEEIYLS